MLLAALFAMLGHLQVFSATIFVMLGHLQTLSAAFLVMHRRTADFIRNSLRDAWWSANFICDPPHGESPDSHGVCHHFHLYQ